MRRNGVAPAALALAAVAAVVVILAATGTFSGGGSNAGSSSHGEGTGSGGQGLAGSSATAPDCLPSTLQHNAKLPGTSVEVSPAPGSVTASPQTQISFLGAPVSEVKDVSVIGSATGRHEGRLEAYSQGDGGSFLPSRPFAPGEHVSVHAVIGEGAGRRISFSFTVDTPYPTGNVGEFGNPTAAPSEYETFRTLPGVQAPILTVTKADEDPAAGDIFTTNGPGPGRYGPLIYTPAGALVWFDQLPKGQTAEDLKVQSWEGQRDITFWQGKVLLLGFGQGEDVVMNSHYQVVARDRGGNGLKADLHDFQLAGNGIAYNTAFNVIRCNLSSVGGSKNGAIIDTAIQEIDMKTGLVRWEWHSLDHVSVNESETSAPKGRPWDWFHINSIEPEKNGDVFISARNTWAGYQIEEGTGNILWRLGGNKSSFKMGPGTKTAWQHDGRILPNGEVTFFDDGSNPPVHEQSRAMRERLNMATHEVTLTSSISHPSPLLAASQGNVQTLASGNIVVGYGGIPQVSEYSSSGKLLFDAHLPLDMASYRDYRFPWKGEPLSRPSIVVSLNNTSEETVVNMSWNGATEVASWRVLAGGSESSLRPITTVASSGFESSAILTPEQRTPRPKPYAYVEVQALNSAGNVLGTSNAAKAMSYKAFFEGSGK